MENINGAKIKNITNYEESLNEKKLRDNGLVNSIEYVRPELRDDYKKKVNAYEGDSYYEFFIVVAEKCIELLGKGSSVEEVHSCLKQFNALAFAKSKIVNIVEKYSLRGKEFKDYVASFQEDNVIEFPTSKTASRK